MWFVMHTAKASANAVTQDAGGDSPRIRGPEFSGEWNLAKARVQSKSFACCESVRNSLTSGGVSKLLRHLNQDAAIGRKDAPHGVLSKACCQWKR